MSAVIETQQGGPITRGVGVPEGRKASRPLWAAVLAIVFAAAAGFGFWSHGRGPGGPEVYYPAVDFTLHPLEPAATSFTLGAISITEPGQDVQVLSVRPIYSDNLDYLGAFTVWPRDQRDSSLGVGPGFPAKEQPHRHSFDELVPAAETEFGITNTDPLPYPLTISIGFRVRTGDRALLDAVDVTYRAGSVVKHMLVKNAVIACVAPRNCAQPGNESDKAYWAELTHSLHFVQAK